MTNNADAMDVGEPNSFEDLPLFHDVFFTVVPSPDLTDDACLQVSGRDMASSTHQLGTYDISKYHRKSSMI
jgi:hypothetical protein